VLLAFGDYVLDSERRELRRGVVPIAVEPQVFDLLLYLVQQRDRVVSKDDLLQAVWGGRIVSDSALAARINAARRALGDNGEAQRWIRTLPRKGVRFIGAVREEQEPAPARSPPPRLSIVVLPFLNLSSDPEQGYFADGIHRGSDDRSIATRRHARDLAKYRVHISEQAHRYEADRS
jgi:DNA-binding winged helix-turn-helix (wHTH) protein